MRHTVLGGMGLFPFQMSVFHPRCEMLENN